MITAQDTRAIKFAEAYKATKDPVEAAKAISKSQDRTHLARLGQAYLGKAKVQEILNAKEVCTLDREGIAKSLQDILEDNDASVDQKIKAAKALETVLRYGENNNKDSFEERWERFLTEYGDLMEEFAEGDATRFNKVFNPQMDKKGNIHFKIKKNATSSERKERMIILLRTLISQNVFS